jgi:hypothetical protein
MAVDNLYGGAALIRQRIDDSISIDATIIESATQDALEALAKVKPTILVAYVGEANGSDEVMKGSVFIPKQRFVVALAIRDIRDPTTGVQLNTDAGVLSLEILNALSGYKISKDYSALQPDAEQRPRFGKGFGYYVRTYTTQIKI